MENDRSYTLETFEKLFIQNLAKANYMVNRKLECPIYEGFLMLVEGKNILEKQFEYIKTNLEIKVLCTCLFIFIYYYGKGYYNKVTRKYFKLLIEKDNKI